VARENDHDMLTDETGHTLMNNDIFRVEEVTGDGLVVRRVIDDKDQVRLADKPMLYPSAKFGTTELAYAVTGHNGMGGTYQAGEALVTGTEPREWLYTAMTRGWSQNAARAITQPAAADPAPGTRPDPELARQRAADRERAGLPAGPAKKEEHDREPVAVLADCMDRTEAEPAARAYQRERLASADHLGMLHARWADLTGKADRERYRRLVRDAVPGQYRNDLDTPQATWLYRTMRNAELAGLDPAEAVTAAVNSRPLDDARDIPSVIDARMRVMTQPLIPLPLKPWSERVPQIADQEIREYVTEVATAMDARTERLGEHAAETAPPWAVAALGPVPDHPVDRLGWQQRASKISAYRELYGGGSQDDPMGPEPPATSPEQRAAWYAGFAAMTRTDVVDVRSLPDSSLRHMRDSYQRETGWAPLHVGRLLRGVRLGAEEARLQAILAAAEAEVAKASGNHQAAARHEQLAGSAQSLEGLYRRQEEELNKTQEDRDLWDKLTRGSRHLAVAARLRTAPPARAAAGQRGEHRRCLALLCHVPGRSCPRCHRAGPDHPRACRGVQAVAGGPARPEHAGRDPGHDRAPARHAADVLRPHRRMGLGRRARPGADVPRRPAPPRPPAAQGPRRRRRGPAAARRPARRPDAGARHRGNAAAHRAAGQRVHRPAGQRRGRDRASARGCTSRPANSARTLPAAASPARHPHRHLPGRSRPGRSPA
jgi:hypothetical protein